ncbi:hypothetical protein ACPOL_2324 [Acidisarcina polymorpha]|uniref:Uncharacterized protein n=1 Tax=Acidisarcina polymorpha TaxID=2211140 RepID=A0A2Z5FXN6_9BACT|nr:hypothetical protein [Acidisarcina polymorpha]AXC11648.1 hypothetical protein ACPOL_2324 [Acidisarcina polymorpha]
MNGAQNGASEPGSGTSVEDLDVVLGRFQNWTMIAQGKSGDRAKDPPGSTKAKLAGEAREISYEQALKASRYRRPAEMNNGPAVPKAAPNLQTEAAPDPVRSAAEPDPSIHATHRNIESTMWDEVGVNRPLRRLDPLKGNPLTVQTKEGDGRMAAGGTDAIATVSQGIKAAAMDSRVEISSPAVGATKLAPQASQSAANRSRKQLSQKTTATSGDASASMLAALIKSKAEFASSSAKRKAIAPAVFKDVLREQEALASVVSSAAPLVECPRATLLTLRVSDAEQMQIEASAARADLSVSAYLRKSALGLADPRREMEVTLPGSNTAQQSMSISAGLRYCALGIDDLRERLDAALSKHQEQPPGSSTRPGISAVSGIFGRFSRLCMQGFHLHSAQRRVRVLQETSRPTNPHCD